MITGPFALWGVSALTPPGAPTNLNAVADDVDSLHVTWDAPATGDAPAGYEGRWKASSSGVWGAWADLGLVEEWTPTGMQVGSSNDVEVRGYNSGGDGTAAGDTATTENLNAPSSVSAVAAATHPDVDISWVDNSNGEDNFEIHRRTDAGSYSGTPIATDPASPHTDTTSEGGETYWYKIRAKRTNARGTFFGAYSAEDSVALRPDTPVGLAVAPQAETATGEAMYATWTVSDGATGYDVRRAPDDGTGSAPATGSAVQIATGVAFPEYTDGGRTANTHWWYQVRATNAGGASPWSSWVRGTTYRDAPGIGAATDPGSCPYPVDITLTFVHTNLAGVSRNTAFEWRGRLSGGSFGAWNAETGGTTSSTDPGRAEGTYEYEVRYTGNTPKASTTHATLCPD